MPILGIDPGIANIDLDTLIVSIIALPRTSVDSHTQHLPHFYAAMDHPSATDPA